MFSKKNELKKIVYWFVFSCVVFFIIIYIHQNTISVMYKNDRKIPIYSVDSKEKKIAITFDVNWGTDNTRKILDLLDQYNIKATFFVIGGWAEENPDLLKEIYERGHEIGNHSDTHPQMTNISKEKIKSELLACDAKILKYTGNNTKLFRCPSGAYNDMVIQTAEEMGYYCIQWNVDSIDWKEQGADIELQRIERKSGPGSILLFHNNTKYTPQNLQKFIPKLQKEGYTFVKVGDLIYKENYYIDKEGKQISR